MERKKIVYGSVFFGMLAVIVALAVVLTAVLIDSRKVSPLVDSPETLKAVNLVNQQLQDVLVPQLKGADTVLQLNERSISRERFTGTFRFSDHRAFWGNSKDLRFREVGVNADFTVAGNRLEVENYKLTSGSEELSETGGRFYQDLLIPYAEFFKTAADPGAVELSSLVVDENKIGTGSQDQEYQKDAVARLNAFFGTNYTADANGWRQDFRGQYAVAFSVDGQASSEEMLAALAELDQIEGLSVTGIYYGQGEGPALCKPFRKDDTINTKALDPRESLRLLASHREIVEMLLSSEFYGGIKADFQAALDCFGTEDSRVYADPIGACVVTDEGCFLSPEMFEAISKVCYRCIDVKLLAAV